MSDIGNILTGLSADVAAAVSGVTVELGLVHPDKVQSDQLPWCRLIVSDYGAEALDWSQEQQSWTIVGLLVAEKSTTQEAMRLLLEAIRAQVVSDPTLGGYADEALCAPLLAYKEGDDPRTYGDFTVQARKVPL